MCFLLRAIDIVLASQMLEVDVFNPRFQSRERERDLWNQLDSLYQSKVDNSSSRRKNTCEARKFIRADFSGKFENAAYIAPLDWNPTRVKFCQLTHVSADSALYDVHQSNS